MKNYTPIRVGTKVIGQVIGDAFIKRVRASRHFLTTPPAIALDIGSLTQAERAGAVWVQIIEIESGTTYRATIRQIREQGVEFDRGYGRQVYLPLNSWIKSRPGGATQLVLAL